MTQQSYSVWFVTPPPPHKSSTGFVFFSKDNFERPSVDYGPVQNDPRCGLSAQSRNVAQRRIVGGNEAGFGSFPWQAYIRVGKTTIQSVNLNKASIESSLEESKVFFYCLPFVKKKMY